MITKDRSYRTFDFEARELADEGKKVIRGLPVVFNQETVIWEHNGVEYKEVIAPGAFDNAKMDDVVLNIDHVGKPAAKTKNGTLVLTVRDDGLHMEADISKNATGRELYEDIQNDFYDKMSFAFTVAEDSYDRDTRTRTIRKIKRLFDVSVVTFPAYEQTSVSARSFFEAEAQREVEEAEAAQALKNKAEAEAVLRKKLIAKTYL